MRNLLASTMFFGLLAVTVLLGGSGCGSDDLTGHGCGEVSSPAACGAPCVGDASCGNGTYCGSDKTCTADCVANDATACGEGKFCSARGTCDVPNDMSGDGGNPFDRDGACAVLSSQATLEKSPVDIIIVVDNSGSMSNEIKGIQTNINTNFATIIGASGLDYRVILIGKHGDADADQSICIDKPLSGNMTCTPPGMKPVNTANFFHYSTEIDSHNSLVKIISTYNQADPSGAGATGWSGWLRPSAYKTFIEITDDEATGNISTGKPANAANFDDALLALVPKNFGDATKRNYKFHSIIGLKENSPATTAWAPTDPLQTTKCTAPAADAAPPAVGTNYQNLSIMTGGLRYPICQYQNFDAVFKAVAMGVIASGQVACDFAVPMSPDGKTISLEQIAVAYTPGAGGATQYFKQSTTSAACVADSFYVDAGRIYLCPATCTALKADPTAKVEVLFTCESTIL